LNHTAIYSLADPSTGEIRYVGRSTNPKARLREHVKHARNMVEDTHKARWIRALLAQSQRPALSVIEVVEGGAWQERERYWISELRSRGCKLTNLSDGGDGNCGFKHRPESIEKYRLKMKGRPKSEEHRRNLSIAKTGMKMSDAFRQKMRERMLRQPMSPEGVAKNAAVRRGKKMSDEARYRMRAAWLERVKARGIYVFDGDGNVVAKRCPKCMETLPIESFYLVRKTHRRHGRTARCKECE